MALSKRPSALRGAAALLLLLAASAATRPAAAVQPVGSSAELAAATQGGQPPEKPAPLDMWREVLAMGGSGEAAASSGNGDAAVGPLPAPTDASVPTGPAAQQLTWLFELEHESTTRGPLLAALRPQADEQEAAAAMQAAVRAAAEMSHRLALDVASVQAAAAAAAARPAPAASEASGVAAGSAAGGWHLEGMELDLAFTVNETTVGWSSSRRGWCRGHQVEEGRGPWLHKDTTRLQHRHN
jgi:hypothetical protein